MTLVPIALALLAALAAQAAQYFPPPNVAVTRPQPSPATGTDWRDAPLTPGSWSLRLAPAGSEAAFGPAAASAQLVLRCDLAARRVRLAVPLATAGRAATAATMIITTSSQSRRLAGLAGPASVEAQLAAGDPLLDAIAFSRGRWTLSLDGPGAPVGSPAPAGREAPAGTRALAGSGRLVLPVSAEAARIVEDCRN